MLEKLQVHPNGRYLQTASGQPFFWLGDTAWELYHRLSREEAEHYLDNRRQKGFTVIQAVALAELDGLHTPNVYGHTPLHDDDPTRPNDAYFQYVDEIIDMAAEKGLYTGLLPTWGDKVRQQWGIGPVIFNAQNARVYGRWLGERYQDRSSIVWILGGDRNGDGYETIWREMALGIREDAGHDGLITYHPQGVRTSSTWFHHEDWLDFNTIQTGHHRNSQANWEMVDNDWLRYPARPVLVGEPCYEDIPDELNGDDYLNAYDTRKAAYWAVFSGAFGHTYGHNAIWQMLKPEHTPNIHIDPGITWDQAIDRPGATHMGHLRKLVESRPFFNRVPDVGLVKSAHMDGRDRIAATRADDRSYAMVYIPRRQRAITLHEGVVGGEQQVAWWFDPRTGQAEKIAEQHSGDPLTFTAPRHGNDWVLVVDDAAQGFGAPGESNT